VALCSKPAEMSARERTADVPSILSPMSGPDPETMVGLGGLEPAPRPYQGSVVRFYNDIQDRGDCQAPGKS
jgi:hypothetical protein